MTVMSIEDELALIAKNRAPAAPAAPAVEDAAPVDPDIPPPEENLPGPSDNSASLFWDVAAAAWRATTIKTDAWGYEQRQRTSLWRDIYTRLPAAGKARIDDMRYSGTVHPWSEFERVALEEAEASAKDAPQFWSDLPLTTEAFDARILGARKADLADAQTVLDRPGGAVAEFMGSAARELTRPVNLATLPLGGGAGGLWKTIATEFAAGAFSEAVALPEEVQTAKELDLPAPDILSSIAAGGLMQAGFAGGLHLIGAGVAKWVGHRNSIQAATPDNGDALKTEIEIDRAEAALRGEETPQDILRGVDQQTVASVGPLPGAEALPYNEAAVVRSIIGVESGGNPSAKNPLSSATGLGQFTAQTWLATIRKYRPDLTQGRSANEVLALRNDGQLSAQMTALYARETAATLQANGLTTEPGNIYLGHFMGPGGAVKALKAPLDTPISQIMSPKEIAANKGIRYGGKSFPDFTAGDLRRWAAHKMRAAYDPNASRAIPDYSAGTSRGYTGAGQVAVGDEFRIDVAYEVVDASTLVRASGPLQPRDRSRIASDAWIADTAARLDPAQLLPSPTADRGAPIVGPDNMIESGNGRFGAIERAYQYNPDRAAAYRSAIEGAGFAIPEGVSRPVLIARRTSDLSPEERVRMTVAAQDPGVVVMTATETARARANALTTPILGRLDPAQPIAAEANGDFVRAALETLPRSARNAMFDAKGLLNKAGERQLREAIFARAWDDPDIVEMFTEGDAGELKSLLEALADAAPAWAALKAEIEAGRVTPEFDISGHVLDAMRLIGAARVLAAREKLPIAKALSEVLDDVDLIRGAVAPLTTAMVKKFWANGRAAPAEDVARFLTRYADDARKAGAAGGLLDAPTPRDVLRAIDGATFGDLPEDLGPVRGFARPGDQAPKVAEPTGYDAGAQSPEAEAADQAARDALEGPGLTPAADPEADAMAAAIFDARATLPEDMTIDLADGTTVSVRQYLDDIDADFRHADIVQGCAITQGPQP